MTPIVRFDGVERAVHWVTAVLLGVCMVTAACLYVPSLSAVVGRRTILRDIHVVAGFLVPLPLLVAVATRYGAGLRRDLRRLNRFGPCDWTWLRSRGRAGREGLGKFNPGQKLNAAFLAGAVVVLLGTGSIMRWFAPFSDAWRTGATFVHDWTAFAVLVALTGHVVLALRDPHALRAMRRGTVPPDWAREKAPRWAEEVTADSSGSPVSGR